MDHQLVRFDILGLHNVRDYSINFKDNKLILVGENGSGKTTVFKIMYYALTCDWDSLCTFVFDEVIIHFKGRKQIVIPRSLLQSTHSAVNIERPYYYSDRIRSRQAVAPGLINDVIRFKTQTSIPDFDGRISLDSNIPYHFLFELSNNKSVNELANITKRIDKSFNSTILYLPTYRRIEEQLKNIFPYLDKDDWNKAREKTKNERSIELIEFGMEDVERAVKEYQDNLNNFSRVNQNKLTLGYLSEIISEKYEHVDVNEIMNLSDQQVDDILLRIDSGILPDHQKEIIVRILSAVRDTHQSPTNVKEKIICHYFLKLIEFDKELSSEESRLLKFVDICNKYLVCNSLVYNSRTFSCSIFNKIDGVISESEEVQFQNLSSGEKQIVSLFSNLNLNQMNRLFVFIDEPELSLSVDWQRMLLTDILDSVNCIGLVATTHSPFVFENDLEEYVHGINEFSVVG